MTGTRSVYFDLDTELIIMRVQKEKHIRSFSRTVNYIIQQYEQKTDVTKTTAYQTLQSTMLMYKERMLELQVENTRLKKMLPEIEVEHYE